MPNDESYLDSLLKEVADSSSSSEGKGISAYKNKSRLEPPSGEARVQKEVRAKENIFEEPDVIPQEEESEDRLLEEAAVESETDTPELFDIPDFLDEYLSFDKKPSKETKKDDSDVLGFLSYPSDEETYNIFNDYDDEVIDRMIDDELSEAEKQGEPFVMPENNDDDFSSDNREELPMTDVDFFSGVDIIPVNDMQNHLAWEVQGITAEDGTAYNIFEDNDEQDTTIIDEEFTKALNERLAESEGKRHKKKKKKGNIRADVKPTEPEEIPDVPEIKSTDIFNSADDAPDFDSILFDKPGESKSDSIFDNDSFDFGGIEEENTSQVNTFEDNTSEDNAFEDGNNALDDLFASLGEGAFDSGEQSFSDNTQDNDYSFSEDSKEAETFFSGEVENIDNQQENDEEAFDGLFVDDSSNPEEQTSEEEPVFLEVDSVADLLGDIGVDTLNEDDIEALDNLFNEIDIPEDEDEEGEKKKKKAPKEKKPWYIKLFGMEKIPENKIKPILTEEELAEIKAKKAEEKKAAAEAKKATADEKKKAAAEAKAAKARQSAEEKEAARKKKLELAEQLILEETDNTTKLNKYGILIIFSVILGIIALVIGIGSTVNYNIRIRQASKLFDNALVYQDTNYYTLAYDKIYGLDIEEEDYDLYDKITTVNFVSVKLTEFNNHNARELYADALDDLFEGLMMFRKWFTHATVLGAQDDMYFVRSVIYRILYANYGITEDEAMAMLQMYDTLYETVGSDAAHFYYTGYIYETLEVLGLPAEPEE